MARPKKDASSAHFYLDNSLQERLEKYCEETGQSKTLAVERMLTNELDKYYSQPKGKRVPR